MRRSTSIDTAAAAKAPGVVAVFTGADMAADEHRRPAVRLADPQQGRLADGRAAASGARGGQGAPRRRSGRGGDRRDEAGGEGRGRADRDRLRGSAGGGVAARCGRAGRRAGARRCAGQHLLRLAYRRQGGGRCRFRQGGEGGEARSHQQPPDPERDGAARRDRRVRRPQRRLSRCTPPARTRT